MTTYEERVHPIHLQSQYGTAARRLDALWHDAARIENYAESLDWRNDDANERAAAAWNVYENERMAALVAVATERDKLAERVTQMRYALMRERMAEVHALEASHV